MQLIRITTSMFNLHKRLWLWRKMRYLQTQFWDKEFTKRQLQEIREGIRQTKDRLRDQVDAAGRRLCEEKYVIYYSETGDVVSAREIPLDPTEIETLPEVKTEGSRYHKVTKAEYDTKVAENLENYLKRYRPQLDQLAEQIQGIDRNINGPLMDQKGNDVSLAGLMDGYMQVMELLRKYKRSL